MTSTSPEPRLAVHTGSTQWTYLTNHAHVLLAIARDHDVRLREIASQVGITERAVQKIIAELEESGALTKSRDGRRNHYEVNADATLRHPMEAHRTIGALVQMVQDDAGAAIGTESYAGNDRMANGHAGNGHAGNGNGHFANGRSANGQTASVTTLAMSAHAGGNGNGHGANHNGGHRP